MDTAKAETTARGRPPTGLDAPIAPWPAEGRQERISADLARRRARNEQGGGGGTNEQPSP
jgi:hypothetical protein